MRPRHVLEGHFHPCNREKNGEAPGSAEPSRKNTFIINRFRKNPHRRRAK
jgi:hypothetical protein